MKAAHIRKDAYKLLNYACQHCDGDMNFTGKTSEITERLHIDSKTFQLALLYLRSSGMLELIQSSEDDTLTILGIHFEAINWLADFT